MKQLNRMDRRLRNIMEKRVSIRGQLLLEVLISVAGCLPLLARMIPWEGPFPLNDLGQLLLIGFAGLLLACALALRFGFAERSDEFSDKALAAAGNISASFVLLAVFVLMMYTLHETADMAGVTRLLAAVYVLFFVIRYVSYRYYEGRGAL